MIVVGILEPGTTSSATVVEVARRAAATGARTELVGVAPAGPAGDRQLVELAAAGVGHATVTRTGMASSAPATGPDNAPGPSPGIGPDMEPGVEHRVEHRVEPADLELALRYLPDVRAIVLVEPVAALLATASAASAWSGATLVVIAAAASATAGAATSAAVPMAAPEPIVIESPARDPDGAFAGLVATLAGRLDAGEDPATAWQSTLAALAVDPA